MKTQDQFSGTYAANYARRMLRGGSQGKGSADRVQGERKASSDSHTRVRVDENTVSDLVQQGFVIWWQMPDHKLADLTPQHATRIAMREAIRRHWKASRRIADRLRYAADRARRIGPSYFVREVSDAIPDTMPTATATAIRTIVRILASGGTQADAASELGVSAPYVSMLVGMVREMFA